MSNIHTIYNSEISIKDWVKDREEIMIDEPFCSTCEKKDCRSCSTFYYHCVELNNEYLYDEIRNLNIPLSNNVIALADFIIIALN